MTVPEIQITAVCDPVKDGTNYVDWSAHGIRDSIRKAIENPTWGDGVSGIRGGRDMAKEILEHLYYAKKRASDNFSGISSYADFRELPSRKPTSTRSRS